MITVCEWRKYEDVEVVVASFENTFHSLPGSTEEYHGKFYNIMSYKGR